MLSDIFFIPFTPYFIICYLLYSCFLSLTLFCFKQTRTLIFILFLSPPFCILLYFPSGIQNDFLFFFLSLPPPPSPHATRPTPDTKAHPPALQPVVTNQITSVRPSLPSLASVSVTKTTRALFAAWHFSCASCARR